MAIPVKIKVIVAIIDLSENRPIPQMPCPLVQPLLNLVPIPTNSPEKIINGKAKIIDGDTIHIGKNKIRLHAIDAPEINQTCSKKIKNVEELKNLKKFDINMAMNQKRYKEWKK